MHPNKTKFLAVLLTLLAVIVAAAALAPWKTLIETRLKGMLAAQGFTNAELTVAGLGLRGIKLENISLGGNPPLTLGNVTIGFALPDLVAGRLGSLNLANLSFAVEQKSDSWVVPGLQEWLEKQPASDGAKTTIPVTADALAAIPLDRAALADSTIHIAGRPWQMDVPLNIAWQKAPAPSLTYRANGLHFGMPGISVSSGDAGIETALDEQAGQWNGTWKIQDVAIDSADLQMPPLNGSGTITAKEEQVVLSGAFGSADGSHAAAFTLDYALNNKEKSQFVLTRAKMPWQGGELSVQNVVVPLGITRAIKIKLDVHQVPIGMFMQTLTGEKATATGAVSGTIPVTIHPDGNVTVEKGKLEAEGPGTIAMAPDAIPGDNQQVALVRDILQNLHYTLLSFETSSGRDNRISVRMALEGNNPDVQQGRPVKLNVHLTGDVLDFVQQNILLLTDPEKLLRQEENANP
ncbi:MAG: hypothetical protein GC131_00525 [Alphaproteobacteria bacterium]|nr:hypothetical protein [Alphaproteobacteria bacterium]